jgi:hypothetical protein
LERDLLEYIDGLNVFEYAVSDPIRIRDPYGQSIQEIRIGNTCYLHVYKDGWKFFVFYSESKHLGTFKYNCCDYLAENEAWVNARTLESTGQLDDLTDGIKDTAAVAEEVVKLNPIVDTADAACEALEDPCLYNVAAVGTAFLPGKNPLPGKKYFRGKDGIDGAKKHLEQYHGISPELFSERLHDIKKKAGLGGADEVVIGPTGDCFCAKTNEFIGSLTEGGAK